jgi:hypothetical protein
MNVVVTFEPPLRSIEEIVAFMETWDCAARLRADGRDIVIGQTRNSDLVWHADGTLEFCAKRRDG